MRADEMGRTRKGSGIYHEDSHYKRVQNTIVIVLMDKDATKYSCYNREDIFTFRKVSKDF